MKIIGTIFNYDNTENYTKQFATVTLLKLRATGDDQNAISRKIETPGAARAARSARRKLHFPRISKIERPRARSQSVFRIRPPKLFRIHFRNSGSVWRGITDCRIIYTRRGLVAGYRGGSGDQPDHCPVGGNLFIPSL